MKIFYHIQYDDDYINIMTDIDTDNKYEIFRKSDLLAGYSWQKVNTPDACLQLDIYETDDNHVFFNRRIK
jgi:hypothetical protein